MGRQWCRKQSGRKANQGTCLAKGCLGLEAGEREGQTGPGLDQTFVLRAAAVSWGNGKENTLDG